MRHYQLSPNLRLSVNACRPVFKCFVGKTNRLALISLNAFGVALDLYITRQWDYPAWDPEPEFVTEEAPALPLRQKRQKRQYTR